MMNDQYYNRHQTEYLLPEQVALLEIVLAPREETEELPDLRKAETPSSVLGR